MSTNNSNYSNPVKEEDFTGSQNKQRLQYGKKGWKPRNNRSYKLESMDAQITNDPKYWNQAVTFDNVTKFTWPLIVGNTYDVDGLIPAAKQEGEIITNGENGSTPPAIMKISYITGPGWADTTNSGVNRSLAGIMSRLRSSLSTSNIGFETASLGLFEASTASIPMCFAIAKRALRCRKLWKERNYAFPRAIIGAMGFDFDDLLNVNYYASKLNAMIEEYNGMFIPDFSYVYDRHYTFANNIYLDEDSDYGQAYVFMPENVYIYRDKSMKAESIMIDSWISELQSSATMNGEPISRFEAFLQMTQKLIDAWKLSSDFFQINGVLRRALPDVPRQNVPLFSLDDVQSTVVDRAVTMQLMNATIIGDAGDLSYLDITYDPADPTHILWKPRGMNDISTDKQILRVFEDLPSADDNMEMTRLLNFQRPSSDPYNPLFFQYCGDMLVRKVSIFIVDAREGTFYEDWGLTSNFVTLDLTSTDPLYPAPRADLILRGLTNVQNFRYIPTIHILVKMREYVDGEGMVGDVYTSYIGLAGDVYNYEVYDFKDFKELQNSAFQSIWKPKFAI